MLQARIIYYLILFFVSDLVKHYAHIRGKSKSTSRKAVKDVNNRLGILHDDLKKEKNHEDEPYMESVIYV